MNRPLIAALVAILDKFTVRVANGEFSAARDIRLHVVEYAAALNLPMPKKLRNCGHVCNFRNELCMAFAAMVTKPTPTTLNRFLAVLATADAAILAASDSRPARLLSKTVEPPEMMAFNPKSLPAEALQNNAFPGPQQVNQARERAFRAEAYLTRGIQRIEKKLADPKRNPEINYKGMLANTKIQRHALRCATAEIAHNF